VGGHSLGPAPTLNVDLEVANPMSTSPGELLAGGFGVIFATSVANQLVREQTQASELVVQVAFVLSQDGPGLDPILRKIRCQLEARVAGIDEAQLADVGEQAMRRSIDSLAMNADAISVSLTIALVRETAARVVQGPHSNSVGAAMVSASGNAEAPAIGNGQIA
jgi:organic hydroperoxide reductase OsmC/OhrA